MSAIIENSSLYLWRYIKLCRRDWTTPGPHILEDIMTPRQSTCILMQRHKWVYTVWICPKSHFPTTQLITDCCDVLWKCEINTLLFSTLLHIFPN